jgi:hypothetical protein
VGRRLYKDRRDPTAQALAALDLKLGIVEGFWTQRAAEQAHVARRPGAVSRDTTTSEEKESDPKNLD